MVPAQRSRLSLDERRQLLAEDTAWIGKPFDVGANPRAVQANARHMALMLRGDAQLDRAHGRRAGAVAVFASDLLETLIKHQIGNQSTGNQTAAIACAKGCSYCCTTFVSATIPEVLRLAARLRAHEAGPSRVMEAAARAQKIPQPRRGADRVICPALEQYACVAYGDRPMACRSLLSTSLAACVRIFEHNSAEPIPHAGKTATIGAYVLVMLKAALVLNGLSARHMELTQGLAVALAAPDTEVRWLAGEPLFDDVPVDEAEHNAHLRALVDALADAVRPTI